MSFSNDPRPGRPEVASFHTLFGFRSHIMLALRRTTTPHRLSQQGAGLARSGPVPTSLSRSADPHSEKKNFGSCAVRHSSNVGIELCVQLATAGETGSATIEAQSGCGVRGAAPEQRRTLVSCDLVRLHADCRSHGQSRAPGARQSPDEGASVNSASSLSSMMLISIPLILIAFAVFS
jgi:hypothetical protein